MQMSSAATSASCAAASRPLVADEEKGNAGALASVLSLASSLRRALHSYRSAIRLPLEPVGFRLRLGGGRYASAAIRETPLSAFTPLSPLADRKPNVSN